MRSRDELLDHCYNFISRLERSTNKNVKSVHGDNAFELVGMRKPLQEKGIKLTSITTYSSLSNGLPKRMTQNLMPKVPAMLKDTKVLWRYWRGALGHASNLHNCTISSALENSKPHESLLGAASDNSRLRILGCGAYVHMDKAARKFKLAEHTQLGIYFGPLNGLYRI